MAGLFRKIEKKYKWDVNLSEDMAHTERVYSPYILYFRQFRQIRHDFANYAQGMQLEESELNFKIQKKRKEKLMEHIDTLLLTLCGRIAVQATGQNSLAQEWCPSFADFGEMGDEKAGRWKSWLARKKYFIQIEKELPRMKDVLMALKERMERRLDFDERETGEFLSDMDAIGGLVDIENPVIAVLFTDMLCSCRDCDIEFRFKMEMPEEFEMETVDLYYICDRLLYFAAEKAKEEAGYKKNPQGDEKVLISFKAASQFGIWHMQVEYPQDTWQSIPPFDGMFLDILKKYKINYKTETKNGNMQIHLIR